MEGYEVTFTASKDEAEVILTDEKGSDNYEKIAYSPLLVVMDESKIENYMDNNYLMLINTEWYTMDFGKILEDTLNGSFTDKIYYPSLSTWEGELFYTFLLIQANKGVYPRNSEEQLSSEQKVTLFLNCPTVIETDAIQKLTISKQIQDELYFMFENAVYSIQNDSFEIAYPQNTVIHEVYYHCNNLEFSANLTHKPFIGYSKLELIITSCSYRPLFPIKWYRFVLKKYCSYKIANTFSYVEIPLRE